MKSHGGQEALVKSNDWSRPALSLLIVYWALCAFIITFSGFFQKEFFNPDIAIPFFAVVAIGELFFALMLLAEEHLKNGRVFWWLLFSANSFLITTIMVDIHWNQSMFFLMYLINIVAAGLTLKSTGGYFVGLLSLIGFNFAVIIAPQNKLMSFLFTLVVNNSALVLVSYLSGQLSDYLENLGLKLDSATRDLRNMKDLHELILRQIPSGILTVDRRGELVQGNEAARQILTNSVFEQKETWEEFRKLLQVKVNLRSAQTEFIWSIDGSKGKILRCQQAALRTDEAIEDQDADIYVIEDVTQIREIEEVLKNQEKLAAVGKLAAGIAHEIRNPLASISGSVQLLSLQAGNEEDKKLFNIVIRETDRLNLLISEFLDYAKPLPKPTQRMNLTALLGEVLDFVRFNKKLRADVLQERLWDGEVYILGFKDKLKQAFLNIIINAYQAMEKTESPRLTVQVERQDAVIILRIRDSGSGMGEETRRRIFEPFYTTKTQGTGLGLAVTHQILESHGASIMVESTIEKGTEFVIKLKDADKLN